MPFVYVKNCRKKPRPKTRLFDNDSIGPKAGAYSAGFSSAGSSSVMTAEDWISSIALLTHISCSISLGLIAALIWATSILYCSASLSYWAFSSSSGTVMPSSSTIFSSARRTLTCLIPRLTLTFRTTAGKFTQNPPPPRRTLFQTRLRLKTQ